MSEAPTLHWLPSPENWRENLKTFNAAADAGVEAAVALANTCLDFVRTNALDGVVRKKFTAAPKSLASKPVRLAVLGAAALDRLRHLLLAQVVLQLRRRLGLQAP